MSLETKKITIEGINNKYQVKKLIQNNKEKKRVGSDKWKIEEFYRQLEDINDIHRGSYEETYSKKLIIQQLEKKISGYKQQDILKKIYSPTKFIQISILIKKIVDSELNCYYCKCNMFLLYEIVRELKQWTLDRIDNNNGHNTDNVVICCLECNLKRRKMSQEKFIFQKNLNIVKHDN
jgi:hypothetical protein